MSSAAAVLSNRADELSRADQEYFDALVEFVETMPADDAAQLDRLAELGRQFGDDIEARVAAFEAGRYPLQQRR